MNQRKELKEIEGILKSHKPYLTERYKVKEIGILDSIDAIEEFVKEMEIRPLIQKVFREMEENELGESDE